MPYVVDYDEDGREVLVPGITFPSMPFPGRIEKKDLLPGDVLVWYCSVDKNSKTHDLIRETTAGAYSHAGIYVGDERSVDAGPEGISEISLKSLLKQFEICNVMRWDGVDQPRIDAALAYAKSCIGYKYASWDAKLLPFRRRAKQSKYSPKSYRFRAEILVGLVALKWRKAHPPKRSVYCSQLIVEAYAAAGLFDNDYVLEAFTSPNDIITEQAFSYMGYISEKAEPKFHDLDVNAPVTRNEIRRW